MSPIEAHALAAKALIQAARLVPEFGARGLRDRLMDEADAAIGRMIAAMPSGRALT